nr:MAG TPA: hypothetical protein [Caudoviricetes sp.]
MDVIPCRPIMGDRQQVEVKRGVVVDNLFRVVPEVFRAVLADDIPLHYLKGISVFVLKCARDLLPVFGKNLNEVVIEDRSCWAETVNHPLIRDIAVNAGRAVEESYRAGVFVELCVNHFGTSFLCYPVLSLCVITIYTFVIPLSTTFLQNLLFNVFPIDAYVCICYPVCVQKFLEKRGETT